MVGEGAWRCIFAYYPRTGGHLTDRSLFLAGQRSAAADRDPNRVLRSPRSGDQVDINVLGADELKGRYPAQDDGTISMPLIGKIPAEGRTVDEVRKRFRQG